MDWAETLDEIGQLYDASVFCIAEANNLLATPNALTYHQELLIPADCGPYDEIESTIVANGRLAPVEDQGGGPTVPSDGMDYRVRWADTLDVIGQTYDISVACIVGANAMINANELHYAQIIHIPGNCEPYDSIESDIISNMEDTRDFGLADSGLGQGGGGGQSLTVPGSDAAPADDTAMSSSAPMSNEVYIIQTGDNLTRLAARFNASAECLMRTNGIWNPDLIYAGNQLIITPACRLSV